MRLITTAFAAAALSSTPNIAQANDYNVPTQSEQAERDTNKKIIAVIGGLKEACPGGFEMSVAIRTQSYSTSGEMFEEFSLKSCESSANKEALPFAQAFEIAGMTAALVSSTLQEHFSCLDKRQVSISYTAKESAVSITTGNCSKTDNPLVAEQTENQLNNSGQSCPANLTTSPEEKERRKAFIAELIG